MNNYKPAVRRPFSVMIKTDAYQNLINNTLGDKDHARQFVADISSVVSQNKALQGCDAGSILAAGLMAQSLKLPLAPTMGCAYVVPYGDKAQFQMGYKGFIQLAQRSNEIVALDVKEVHEGEYLGTDEDGEDVVKFASHKFDGKPIVGYRAYFKTRNGFKKSIYRTADQVKAHGMRYSKTFSRADGLWQKQFDMMAKKTVLKELLSKWAPLSVEFQKAIQADQAVIGQDGSFEYIDSTDESGKETASVVNGLAPEEAADDNGELPFDLPGKEEAPSGNAPEDEDDWIPF